MPPASNKVLHLRRIARGEPKPADKPKPVTGNRKVGRPRKSQAGPPKQVTTNRKPTTDIAARKSPRLAAARNDDAKALPAEPKKKVAQPVKADPEGGLNNSSNLRSTNLGTTVRATLPKTAGNSDFKEIRIVYGEKTADGAFRQSEYYVSDKDRPSPAECEAIKELHACIKKLLDIKKTAA